MMKIPLGSMLLSKNQPIYELIHLSGCTLKSPHLKANLAIYVYVKFSSHFPKYYQKYARIILFVCASLFYQISFIIFAAKVAIYIRL